MNEVLDRRKRKRLERKAREQQQRLAQANDFVQMATADEVIPASDGRLAVRFEPMDTWFFRESRPHNAVGASELRSMFPPPARTLSGALRTLVGENAGVDWRDFKPSHPMAQVIGYGDELGPLTLDGPGVDFNGEPIFPAPAFLLGQGEGAQRCINRLAIGSAVVTDLRSDGMPLHLPTIPGGEHGYDPLEGTWLTAQGMACVLAGGLPGIDMLLEEKGHCDPEEQGMRKALVQEEPRLGIARENAKRTAAEAQLYQTRHLRLNKGVGVTLGVRGLDQARLPSGTSLVRLGGEGRMAALTWRSATEPVKGLRPKLAERTKGLILVLLTPADLSGDWLPPGFVPCKGAGCWTGEIAGVRLEIYSAVIGKPIREGGWDQAAGAPRTVRSLLPAGSAWYCTLDGDKERAIEVLHGSAIGCDQALGRGRLAVGLWPESELPQGVSTP